MSQIMSQMEVKFRAYIKSENRLVDEVEQIIFRDNQCWLHKDSKIGDWYDLNDVILLQYTGLKDRFGKELFAGDIIKLIESDKKELEGLWIIMFDVESMGFVFTKSINDVDALSWRVGNKRNHRKIIDRHFQRIELVGNFYENPNLIK